MQLRWPGSRGFFGVGKSESSDFLGEGPCTRSEVSAQLFMAEASTTRLAHSSGLCAEAERVVWSG